MRRTLEVVETDRASNVPGRQLAGAIRMLVDPQGFKGSVSFSMGCRESQPSRLLSRSRCPSRVPFGVVVVGGQMAVEISAAVPNLVASEHRIQAVVETGLEGRGLNDKLLAVIGCWFCCLVCFRLLLKMMLRWLALATRSQKRPEEGRAFHSSQTQCSPSFIKRLENRRVLQGSRRPIIRPS